MNFKYRDLGLAVLSAFLGSVKGYLVSQVSSLGAVEIFCLRSGGAACLISSIIIYYGYKIYYDRKVNLVLLMRSVVGNIAVCGYYFGFVYLSISEASLLFYSTPIFTIIIGHLFLKESCGLTEIVSTILSACGVFIVCYPQFSLSYTASTIAGVAGSLTGALAQAIALVFVRKITEIPPFVVSFWWAVVGVAFSSSLGVIFNDMKVWRCGWEAVCLVAIAVVGFISEVSLVSALKSTDAVIVSLALTTEIIWAFLLQCFLIMEIPSFMTVIGGVLIGISLLLPPIVSFSIEDAETSDLEKQIQKINS